MLARLDAKRGRENSAAYRKRLFEQMRRAFPISRRRDQFAERPRLRVRVERPGRWPRRAHAALLGKADAIVTDDTRAGFKTSPTLLDAGIEVVYPHEFAATTVSAHPRADVRALVAMSQRMTEPPESPRELLDELQERYEMAEVAAILEPDSATLGS